MNIKNSIMAKMVLLFFVAAIPLYAVGLALYSTSGEQLVMETLETKRSQMEFYLQSVEDELERLSMLEITVINDSTVGSLANRYRYFSIYERGRRINTLRDSLLNIGQSCSYAETVSVYLKPIRMKLNDKSGLDAMTAADETFVKEIAENSRNAICMNGEDLYAVVCVRDTKNDPHYTLVVRLSKERIASDLKSLESSVPTQSVVIFEGRTALAANSKKAEQLWEEASSQLDDMSGGNMIKIMIDGESYYVSSAYSPFMRATLFNFTREHDLTLVTSKYLPYFAGLTVAALVLILVLIHGSNALVHRPLQQLMIAFRRIREEDLTVKIEHHRHDEFSDVYRSFNQTAEMLDEYVNRSLKQELLLRRSEIQQLQAQINPHFLYNSYFMLHRMVKRRDWQNAELFSGYMGEYFRYITRNAKQLVPLEAEAEHARIYSEIQAMRFGGRITVEFGEIPEALRQVSTPRLILQPVLENAFEHGMRDTVDNGLIRVRFFEEGGGCVITVEDNGEVLSEEALNRLIESMDEVTGEVTALKNICHRLQLRAADGLGFELLRSPLGGLCVRMILHDEVK